MKGKLPGWRLRVWEEGRYEVDAVEDSDRERGILSCLAMFSKNTSPNLQHIHKNTLPALEICQKINVLSLPMNWFQYIHIYFFLLTAISLTSHYTKTKSKIISITFRLYVHKICKYIVYFYSILNCGCLNIYKETQVPTSQVFYFHLI